MKLLGKIMLLAFGVIIWAAKYSSATIKLPYLVADSMVLQQQMEVPVWGWAKPGAIIAIGTSWNGKKYRAMVANDGKWKTKIATPAAGGPYTITLTGDGNITLRDVLIGEVWLCTGQSNMEMPMKGFKGQPIIGSNDAILHSFNNHIRLFTVPRSSQTTPQDTLKANRWHPAEPAAVAKFSATGYYFGKLLNEMLHVPVGLICISYGGSSIEAWMDPETLKPFPDAVIPQPTDSIKVVNKTPTTLFNAMLYPTIGYGIRGAIWYQGETNYDKPDEYEQLLPALVAEWRKLWSEGEFPFYYAQIAPYNYAQLPPFHSGGKYNSAYVRDAQRRCERVIPNAGMAVLMDVGEEASIHPMHKMEGGSRLAYLALAKTYGLKGFGFTSPQYDTLTVKDSVATIKFKEAADGLTSFGKPMTTFEIAGADKIFYPAKAAINGSSVTVSAPQVKQPVAVRYAFKDFVTGDLFGTDGLPVSSFRTDSW